MLVAEINALAHDLLVGDRSGSSPKLVLDGIPARKDFFYDVLDQYLTQWPMFDARLRKPAPR
jgi:hypothetical protein